MAVLADYVEDTSGWEDWQSAYRFGVLLIYPPEPIRSEVNSLRARFDPKSHAICDAHISLTVPLPRALHERQWDELQAVARQVEPISIAYGPLTNYLPHPGVVLAIEPKDALDRLRVRLEGASAFADAPARTWPFSAHMTIAEFVSVERTHELMAVLGDIVPVGAFVCDHVSLAVPNRGFRFEERLRLELAH